MNILPIEEAWDTLPTEVVRINWDDPLALTLAAAFYPVNGRMYEVVRGMLPTADTGTIRATGAGQLRDYVSGQKSTFANSARYGLTGPMTIVVICDVDALSNYGALVSCQDSASTNGWEFRLGSGATDSNIISHRSHASGYTQFRASASNLISAGSKNNFIAVTYPSDQIYSPGPTFYVNGTTYSGSYLGGGATGAATASTSTLDIGARAAGTTQLDGAVSFVGLWNSALSTAALDALRLKPRRLIV